MINFDNPTLIAKAIPANEVFGDGKGIGPDWIVIATWWDGEERRVFGPDTAFECCRFKAEKIREWKNDGKV